MGDPECCYRHCSALTNGSQSRGSLVIIPAIHYRAAVFSLPLKTSFPQQFKLNGLWVQQLTATHTTLALTIKYRSLITHNAYSFPELVDRPQYPLQPLTEVEGAQQKSNVTASGSTTSTPPDLRESSQTDFTVSKMQAVFAPPSQIKGEDGISKRSLIFY